MGALIVLSAVAAGAAGLWAAKILQDRAARLDAIREREHEGRIAELVVMAMLADGQLTAEEWAVVRHAFTANGYSLLEADRTIGELRDDAEAARASGGLGAWVAERAPRLTAADRELVYGMVVDLHLSGSALTGPNGEYLAADGGTATLLRLFGDALGIAEPRQRELNLEHLHRSSAV